MYRLSNLWIPFKIITSVLILMSVFAVASEKHAVLTNDNRTYYVNVEAGFYPVVIDANTKKGIVYDFFEEMNKVSSSHEFQVRPLPVIRLKQQEKTGNFDVIFFKAKEWLSPETLPNIEFSDWKVEITSYIWARKQNRDQTFFENIRAKKKIGVLGYNYGLANFIADPEMLINEHGFLLTKDERLIFQMLEYNRGEVGIVSDMTANYLFKIGEADPGDYIYRTTPDAKYSLHLLVPKNHPSIKIKNLDSYIAEMKSKGLIKKVFQLYGIE